MLYYSLLLLFVSLSSQANPNAEKVFSNLKKWGDDELKRMEEAKKKQSFRVKDKSSGLGFLVNSGR